MNAVWMVVHLWVSPANTLANVSLPKVKDFRRESAQINSSPELPGVCPYNPTRQ